MLFTTANIIFGASLLVSLSLIFYYVYFFARLAFYKSKLSDSADAVSLSIIVCARNEEKNLQNNLPHVVKQSGIKDDEILVVNDRSEDDTEKVLQGMVQSFPRLRILNMEGSFVQGAGKKYPLSIGIKEAKHGYLLLTDADCRPASPVWAKKLSNAYTPGIDIVLGYGAYEKHPGLLNKIIRYETFHSALQYLSYALAGYPYMGVGRNLSYKKELFIKNKGFESISHLPGGDDDLFINKVATAKNTAIVIDADAHTISMPKTKWTDWKRQKTRHYSTSKYYKPLHQFLLGVYSLSQFFFYPLIITSSFLFSWEMSLCIFLIKSACQYIIFSKAMKKMGEGDLIRWIFFMDIWTVFYYLLFAHSLWKKEQKTW